MASLDPVLLEKALQRESEPGFLYAIVDGARNEEIFAGLEKAGDKHCCLYEGKIPPVLAKAAPHLVRCDLGEQFLPWLLEQGWGDSWGIFVHADTTLEVLRKHFRRFLKVETEDGKKIYFRYYDPRVFRVYLPTCNEEELKVVFGPVARYMMESKDASELLGFSVVEGEIEHGPIELEPKEEEDDVDDEAEADEEASAV